MCRVQIERRKVSLDESEDFVTLLSPIIENEMSLQLFSLSE